MSVSTSPRPATFVLQLQSIRALAALAVAACHSVNFPLGFEDSRWAKAALNIFYGHGAVFTFFIISGFVLGLTLENRPRTLGTCRRFIGKRLTRLFPALLVSTSIYAAYRLCFHHFYAYPPNRVYDIDEGPFSLSVVLQNAILWRHRLNGVTWSLQVEGFYGLLLPFIYFAIGRNRFGNLLVFLALAALFYLFPLNASDWRANDVFLSCLVICQAGYLVSLYREALAAFFSRLPRAILALLCVLALATCLSTPHFGHHDDLYIAAATFLVALIVSGRPRFLVRWLDWKPLLWLGTMSYSFYLFHPLFLRSCLSLSWLFLPRWLFLERSPLLSLFLFIVSVGLTIPFAMLSYHFLEKPFTSAYRKVKAAA